MAPYSAGLSPGPSPVVPWGRSEAHELGSEGGSIERNTAARDLGAIERVIRRALLAGGRPVRFAFQSRDFRIDWKPDGTPVTSADVEVQRVIESVLREEMPGVAVVGEESWEGAGHDSGAAYFVVDPIDGTTNFLRGIPFFGATCAFLEAGRPQVGAVYDPVHDDYFHALRGAGAWWNDRAAAPEPVREVERAELCLPLDTLSPEWRSRVVAFLLPRVYKVRAPRSSALEICGVGCGRFAAGLHGRVSVWDAAAAALFVEEAGGAWSRLEGAGEWQPGLRSTLLSAATPELHDAIVAVLRR